jgi:AcrR family transcriptional regulator
MPTKSQLTKHLDPEVVQRRAHIRRPARARGVQRLNILLDATARVLERVTDGEISLADIAAESGVPLPSVYHFFPNRISALVALAARYHGELANSARTNMDSAPDWQGFMRMWYRRGANYLNERPAALRLFMGAGISLEVRHLDFGGNERIAAAHADQLRSVFRCDDIEDLEHYLRVSAGLLDGIWSLSYAEHGRVTDGYLAESTKAVIAYMRCYLPEHLPLRHPPSSIA